MFEELKRGAYRYAWPKRFEKTPIKRISWGKWFELKYGESITEYHEKQRKQKYGNQNCNTDEP